MDHLREVFKRRRAAGLCVKSSKCDFLNQSLEYLGHIVSKDGVELDPWKTDAIKNLKSPTLVKDARQFLGIAGCY